jgi:hypothetical protein
METSTAELAPEKVIRWLRSPAGEQWSSKRTEPLARHHDDAGVFAEVIPDSRGKWARTSWPDPLRDHDLGSE